ncbi:MAG: protein BatD [Deltaproteobacteria bacterium]|nr:protein BatD [Deltaproteobacteria bacterium]
MMIKLFILGVLILFGNPAWGDVTAWVNKNPAVVGDMFQLHVEAKNVDDAEEPDLSEITGFQILNRSVQNQTSIVGTSITRTLSWTYIMIAPSSGDYLIPALKVGNEQSTPIALKVTAYSQNQRQKYVSLDMEVFPKKVYPQQQILVRLRISRTGVQLENETITPFELKGALVEELSQKSHQTVKNGKKHKITEILYAVIPEKSGTLVIPQVRYQGEIIQRGSSQNNFGNIFQKRGQRIFSTSTTQSVEVKALPTGFKNWWLPTDKLVIEEKWQPDPPVFRVGEPVTRTVAIFVNGVSGNQIPELKFDYPVTLKGYADQPLIETEKSEKGLKGMRLEKWALIPSQPGKIELPGVSVSWWDIKSDSLQTAVISPKIFDILPVLENLQEIPEDETPELQVNQAATAEVVQEKETAIESFFWKILAFGFAFIWCATMLMWFINKNNKAAAVTKNENKFIQNRKTALREATRNAEKAFRSGDPGIVQTALLKWGTAVWIDDPPQGLEQIGERLPELKNGINDLNLVLYGNNQTKESSMEKLFNDFNKVSLLDKKFNNNKVQPQLEPLYPE